MARLLFISFLALLLTACIDVESPDLNTDADDRLRTVSVSGHGEVKVEPDQAELSLAINLRGNDLSALQQKAGQIMTDFLQLTRDLNIIQVKTSQLHVQPLYHWNEGQQVNDGFEIQRNIEVTLKELEKLGLLIERAMTVGINQISPPDLQSSKAEVLRQEALAEAASDARAKALLLATQLDVSLGSVRQISATDRSPEPRMVRMASFSQENAGAAQTYQPGLITFTADVQATFDLAVN